MSVLDVSLRCQWGQRSLQYNMVLALVVVLDHDTKGRITSLSWEHLSFVILTAFFLNPSPKTGEGLRSNRADIRLVGSAHPTKYQSDRR